MKRKAAISKTKLSFAGISILFLGIQLYLYAACTSSSYKLQMHKKRELLLTQEEQHLKVQLADAQNLETIKKYAKEKLHMHQIPFNKLKKLTLQEEKK